MDLPVPEGQVKEKSFASHSTMSKSFGLQRKTLVRVIGLENRVGKLESNVAGISIEKFTEINQTIKAVNDNLQSIGGLLDAELVAEKQEAKEEGLDKKREIDEAKRGKIEKFLEMRNETKVLKPVVKATKTAKSVFQRLFDALSSIFAGWMLDKGAKMIEAWQSGDTETFEKMKNEIVKALTIVGGIFLAVNLVGIIGALKALIIGIKIGIPLVIGLLANPWVWLAIAVGAIAWMGFSKLKEAVGGGPAFEDAENRLGAVMEDEAGVLGRQGMNNVGYLLKEDPNNPGNYLEQYVYGDAWSSSGGPQGTMKKATQTVFTKTLAPEDLAEYKKTGVIPEGAEDRWVWKYPEKRAAWLRLRQQKAVLTQIKKDMGNAIRAMKKAADEKAKDEIAKNNLEGNAKDNLWRQVNKIKKFEEDLIRKNYADYIMKTFPELYTAKELEGLQKGKISPFVNIPDLYVENVDPDWKAHETSIKTDVIMTQPEAYTSMNKNLKERAIQLDEAIIKDNFSDMELKSEKSDINNSLVATGNENKNENSNKFNSINTSAFSNDNISIIPFETSLNADSTLGDDYAMNFGDATEFPDLFTFDNNNDYRDFFSYVYDIEGDK